MSRRGASVPSGRPRSGPGRWRWAAALTALLASFSAAAPSGPPAEAAAARAAANAATAAAAADAHRCALPAEIESAAEALPNFARVVRDPAAVARVVVLSSQPAATRPSVSDIPAYPARLGAAIAQELAPATRARKPSVEVVGKPLGSTEDLATLIGKRVLPLKPQLVVWQIGRADARRGTAPYRFAEQLNRGLGALTEASVDVIVLDIQYHPQFEAMFRTDEYRNYIRWGTAKRDIGLLRRYDMIEHWTTEGRIDLDSGSPEGERASFEFIQACLSHHLGRMIAAGVRGVP